MIPARCIGNHSHLHQPLTHSWNAGFRGMLAWLSMSWILHGRPKRLNRRWPIPHKAHYIHSVYIYITLSVAFAYQIRWHDMRRLPQVGLVAASVLVDSLFNIIYVAFFLNDRIGVWRGVAGIIIVSGGMILLHSKEAGGHIVLPRGSQLQSFCGYSIQTWELGVARSSPPRHFSCLYILAFSRFWQQEEHKRERVCRDGTDPPIKRGNEELNQSGCPH